MNKLVYEPTVSAYMGTVPLSPASTTEYDDNTWVTDFLRTTQPFDASMFAGLDGYQSTPPLTSAEVSQSNSPEIKSEPVDFSGIDIKLEDLGAFPADPAIPPRQRRKSSVRGPRKKLTASQKQAHNRIEKKYRISINEKIAGLQKIIPAVAQEPLGFATESADTVKQAASNRLNKSAVLEKATEYILFLQNHSKKLAEVNAALKKQVLSCGGVVDQ